MLVENASYHSADGYRSSLMAIRVEFDIRSNHMHIDSQNVTRQFQMPSTFFMTSPLTGVCEPGRYSVPLNSGVLRHSLYYRQESHRQRGRRSHTPSSAGFWHALNVQIALKFLRASNALHYRISTNAKPYSVSRSYDRKPLFLTSLSAAA